MGPLKCDHSKLLISLTLASFIVLHFFPNIKKLPIKPRCFDIHVEVVCDLVDDHGEGGALLLPLPLVVGNDVRVPVPQLPQLTRVDAGILDLVQK